MKKTDFIPQSDRSLVNWLKVLYAYLLTKFGAWNIPTSAVNELNTLILTFSTAFDVTENPATKTKVTVQLKNAAKKAVKDNVRSFLKAYVTYNPLVTDADRDAMALPVHKTTHEPAPVSQNYPWVQVVLYLIRHLRFEFGASETSKAKPAGQHGMELAGRVSEEKPTDIQELTLSFFDTHTPLTIAFKEDERGKTFWYAVRWENTRGEKGPWSEIQSTIIP
jgi:hypothetical protein